MSVTAIVSLKGGTGKTTTTLNLGASLAGKGARVMLVDLDPQASLSYALNFRNEGTIPTIADVFLRHESIHDVIWRTRQENLYLCPSDIRLLELNNNAEEMGRAARVFAANLRSIKRHNAYVLIDCPPAMTGLSALALHASDFFLVPTPVTPMSVEALRVFLGYAEETNKRSGSKTQLLGILLTMVNPYLRLTVETLRSIRRSFKKDVFNTVIRQTVRLAESPMRGGSVFDYAPNSIGADNYHRLRKEFLRRVRR